MKVRMKDSIDILNVHLVESFGDIPSVAEVNLLTGHTTSSCENPAHSIDTTLKLYVFWNTD